MADTLAWDDDYEGFLNNMRQNCVLLANYNKRLYEHYKSLAKWYKIPVIFLSSLNSVFSLSATTFMPQETVSIANSLISLACSILVSIAMYLKIEDILEKENASARAFYLLSVNVFKTLSLKREHRVDDPKSFVDDCLSQYNKLVDNSCLASLKLKDKLAPLDAFMYAVKEELSNSGSLESLEKGL